MDEGAKPHHADDVARAVEQAKLGPYPGELYRHYKGGLYQIVTRSINENSLCPMVTYRDLKTGVCWTRTLYKFHRPVGDEGTGRRRFTPVEALR